MFNIEFFTLPDGSVPALETIRSISDVKLTAKVFRSLKLLESFGNQLGEPISSIFETGFSSCEHDRVPTFSEISSFLITEELS
jgi:hypothetical protein